MSCLVKPLLVVCTVLGLTSAGGATEEVSGAYYDWRKSLRPERPWRHDYSQTLVMKIFLAS